MRDFFKAMAALGCQVDVDGDDPATEAEYNDGRVTMRRGDRPSWAQVQQLMQQPEADDLRAEASRRMRALVGARDDRHLDIIISNNLREAVRLQEKRLGGDTLTATEVARVGQLQQLDRIIEEIRAHSEALELAPPTDWSDDKHWPNPNDFGAPWIAPAALPQLHEDVAATKIAQAQIQAIVTDTAPVSTIEE